SPRMPSVPKNLRDKGTLSDLFVDDVCLVLTGLPVLAQDKIITDGAGLLIGRGGAGLPIGVSGRCADWREATVG
ncbi:MAG: hypothetical protein AAB281_05980, partial [Actinomycetota bacterium]